MVKQTRLFDGGVLDVVRCETRPREVSAVQVDLDQADAIVEWVDNIAQARIKAGVLQAYTFEWQDLEAGEWLVKSNGRIAHGDDEWFRDGYRAAAMA